MVAWWWSWLLTAVGITGLLVAGTKRKAGWAVGLGAQVLWIAYALATNQLGFLVSALAYGSVYAHNWIRWNREENTWPEPRPNQCDAYDAWGDWLCELDEGHDGNHFESGIHWNFED